MSKENTENDNLRGWGRKTYQGEWEEKSGKVREKSDVKNRRKVQERTRLLWQIAERGTHSGEKILDNKLSKITT